MCEYSLEFIAFRPAKIGDKLVIIKFPNTLTYGFVQLQDPKVAVCLLPGTELAFEREVERRHPLGWLSPRVRKLDAKVARFRQVNHNKSWAHHDALEFPDGRTVLLTHLCPGQRTMVLQLPANTQTANVPEHVSKISVGCHEAAPTSAGRYSRAVPASCRHVEASVV
jgi:hypothetical protein